VFVGNSKNECEWDKECFCESKQGSGWKNRGKEKSCGTFMEGVDSLEKPGKE